jgi:transketolase
MTIEQLSIDTIRTLAMDAVQRADSGHPGTPMALAPVAYLLSRQMRYDPKAPDWFDRDRFVLSCGHASMLLYAMLHLSGYDLSLEELERFRQWGSLTPGHPEHHLTPGIETTTGPLGQGLMNAVGMAIAEAHLAAVLNRPGHEVVDHHTYVLASDGDLMEGASHEAGSLAGHLGLGKLIVVYDDNHITIDGSTSLAFSDDTSARFEAYGWHVQDLGEAARDLPRLAEAFDQAREERERPSLIVVRSHIAWGAPHKQDTSAAHGSPLGEEEVAATKRFYGWPEDAHFLVPERARAHMREAVDRGRRLHEEWQATCDAWKEAHPDLADRLQRALDGALPDDWDADLPFFEPGAKPIATRSASGKTLAAIARRVPWLLGGSADLASSNKTRIEDSGDFSRDDRAARNLHYGIREHVMCAASSGMALHGGLRPYAATFFVFTDYARPAIRLAALMRVPVIYVTTHDSIGLGEDGPTHQPIEHLASLRAMPGLRVVRPADAIETVEAWRVAMERTDGPTLFVLSRQNLPVLAQTAERAAEGVRRGAYVLEDASKEDPEVVLLATGSEVSLALEARSGLEESGIPTRVVSMPCWEIFEEQDDAYRASVIPPDVAARVSVEAGATQGWARWVGDGGASVGLDHFGASAPGDELMRQFGFTAEHVAAVAARLAGRE